MRITPDTPAYFFDPKFLAPEEHDGSTPADRVANIRAAANTALPEKKRREEISAKPVRHLSSGMPRHKRDGVLWGPQARWSAAAAPGQAQLFVERERRAQDRLRQLYAEMKAEHKQLGI